MIATSPQARQRRPAAKKRRRKVSAKARAVWKAQGRYLSAVKQLTPAQRAKVKKIREAKGVGPATAAAKRMAK
jgi:hypothetical protein